MPVNWGTFAPKRRCMVPKGQLMTTFHLVKG